MPELARARATGTVFEVLHEWTGRRVAVKLLREDVASDFDASQRFLQEARSATAIDHPNVVEVLDMGRHDEWTVYLVFELLRGQSLADRLETVSRLEPMEAAMILLPVADAVAAAHRPNPTQAPTGLSMSSPAMAANRLDPRVVATLDDASPISAGPLDAERVTDPDRRRIPVASGLLALLVVFVFVFGYRATQLESAGDTDPAATSAEVRSVTTVASPASNRSAELAPEPEAASAARSDEGSPDAPAADEMVRAGGSVRSAITVTAPRRAEPRSRRPRPVRRSAIQHGANGSPILD